MTEKDLLIQELKAENKHLKEQLNQGWHSYNKNPPTESDLYLVTVLEHEGQYLFVEPVLYDMKTQKWHWYDNRYTVDFDHYTIISWRPMLEPFKGK